MTPETAFLPAAVAVAAGVGAQVLAARWRIPAIVPLLVVGVALGPEGAGLVDPDAFATGRRDLVNLAITIILFEGALGLDLDRLREQRRPLFLLLTAGSTLSLVVGALAARLCLGFSWTLATLYGALMIVTGPTVVTPLVARLPLARRVRELVISEGVLIDPLGAIVALVAAEYVVGEHAIVQAGSLVVFRLGIGAALGVLAGMGLGTLLRRHLIPERLVNAGVLAAALLVAALASALSAEAGLMAAVALGVTLANRGVPELGRLREFKETLTIVLLGFLFVLLSSDVRLATIRALGLPGLTVVATLMWLARPLSVAIATAGSELRPGERAAVAWLCPRGIVAASVAGFFRIVLDEAGAPGGADLEALVFLTVAITVTWQGLSAGFAVRAFGADLPAASGAVIVGADALGRLLARTLQSGGRQVAVVDRSPVLCRVARLEGLAVYEADALSPEALEDAGTRHSGTVVALTSNEELNALVAQNVRTNFSVERVLALTPSLVEDTSVAKPQLFPGNFPGPQAVNEDLRRGRLMLHEVPADPGNVGRPLGELAFPRGAFALAVRRQDVALVATSDLRVEAADRVLTVAPRAPATPGA